MFFKAFLFLFNILPTLLYGFYDVSSSLGETNVLRVATLYNLEVPLPRSELLVRKEWRYLEQFARDNHFKIKTLHVKSQEEGFDLLKSQKADLYVSQLIYTNTLDASLNYSLPLLKADEYLVSALGQKVFAGGELSGSVLGIHRNPHQEARADELAKTVDNLSIKAIPQGVYGDQLYRQLNERYYDYVMVQSDQFESDNLYRNDLKKSHQLTEDSSIVWALNKSNGKLLENINFYFMKVKGDENSVDIIRVGLVNHHDGYFLMHGEERGFHFSLIKTFLDERNLSYRIVLAENRYQLKTLLKEKKIDVAADFYTADDVEVCCMRQSEPLFYSSPVFVARFSKGPKNVDVFSERFISVPLDSPYLATLQQVLKNYPSLKLLKVSESISTKAMLRRLDRGVYDLVFAEDYIVDREEQFQESAYAKFPVGDKTAFHWLVTHEKPALLEDIDSYLDDDRVVRVYDQYFRFFNRKAPHFSEKSQLTSPYDTLIKGLANSYDLDARLLTAQMYHESQFDPGAESGKGGIGLFQMHQKPANFLGFYEITLPRNNISAAMAYMLWLKAQLITLEVEEKSMPWFLLAAYYAGIGHVKDAIHLAYKQGWASDRWFGGVARSMRLLEDPRYYTYARFGYIRGSDVVNYVDAIKGIYSNRRSEGAKVRKILVKVVLIQRWKESNKFLRSREGTAY